MLCCTDQKTEAGTAFRFGSQSRQGKKLMTHKHTLNQAFDLTALVDDAPYVESKDITSHAERRQHTRFDVDLLA